MEGVGSLQFKGELRKGLLVKVPQEQSTEEQGPRGRVQTGAEGTANTKAPW